MEFCRSRGPSWINCITDSASAAPGCTEERFVININTATKKILESIPGMDSSLIKQAREEAQGIQVPQSSWCRASGFSSEKAYKAVMAAKGVVMYHVHCCFLDREAMLHSMPVLQDLLEEQGLTLDRFGVSLDPAMAFPRAVRRKGEKAGLYLDAPEDWAELASFPFSQPHLGDHMIGSPASYDSCCSALRVGITTMGNISQFFGWDYPEFPDIEARTRSTVMAMAVMGEHVKDGALIHSNLDDGYGDKCADMGQLIGMALLEQYIAEDLLGAKVAHSFGDMFHSPYKRLVFLAALKQVHGEDVFGSMVFANKLGREKQRVDLNDAHLCTCMLYDMAGQARYRTGHAVTVMADRGLDGQAANEEIVRKLGLAKQLEAYLSEMAKTIDFAAIDMEAARLAARGQRVRDNILSFLSHFIDITDPCSIMLAVKKAGVKALVEELSDPSEDRIPTDYSLYSH